MQPTAPSTLTKNHKLFEIEQETVGQIPEDQRHGTSGSLVSIWAGMNMTPLTVVTGATATTALGLPLGWAIAAILLGHILGGIGMALHAAQGPRLGVPQMLQARGQFGSYGSVIIVLVAAIMFIGYFASNLVVAAQSISAVFPKFDQNTAIVVGIVVSFAIAFFGYQMVRVTTAIGAYVVGALVVLSFIAIGVSGGFAKVLGHGHFTLVGFSAMVAIGVVWQLTYAPYVSDYSRYMPKDSGTRGAFWGTYVGCVASSIVLMILGAIVGIAAADANTMGGLDSLVGPILGFLVLLGFALVAWTGNAVNVYCSTLCAITLVETFVRDWRPKFKARLWATIVLHVVGGLIAALMLANFANAFTDFLSILLYVLIPWSAVNLVDYYVIRDGDYAVSEFYRKDGGRYGRWNIAANIVFAVGIVAQLPFLVTSFYTGPIAQALGGVDVAWLVGFVVSGVAYLLFARFAPRLARLDRDELARAPLEEVAP
ncbi:MAG TPA: cytosine permease [Microbacterium sp.]|nr:cytosine permease [Microbacterium sp.]